MNINKRKINLVSYTHLAILAEKAMAPDSNTLAWKIPWTEEPGGLQSMGSLGVRHDWETSLSLFTFMHWRRKWQLTQCSCLENPRYGGAWWAAVYGVAQSRTRLKRLSSSSSSYSGLWMHFVLRSYQVDSHPCGPPKGKEHLKESPHFNLKFSFLNSFSHLFPCYFHFEWSHMPKEKPHTMKVICSLALFLKARIPGRAKTSKNKMGGDIQEVI